RAYLHSPLSRPLYAFPLRLSSDLLHHFPSDLLYFYESHHLRALPSFPTRRSSDLIVAVDRESRKIAGLLNDFLLKQNGLRLRSTDRKSTRLNSSHLVISYAVFCLKKKKKHNLA